jgi:hypothetical protein
MLSKMDMKQPFLLHHNTLAHHPFVIKNVSCQEQCGRFEIFAIFPKFVTSQIPPPPPITIKCSERTIHDFRGRAKAMFSKTLRMLAKVCPFPRELL